MIDCCVSEQLRKQLQTSCSEIEPVTLYMWREAPRTVLRESALCKVEFLDFKATPLQDRPDFKVLSFSDHF